VDTKALASPLAMPTARKSDGGVMDASVRTVSKSDLHTMGFLAVEGTPAFGKALPFAGRCRNAGLGRFMRTVGASSLPVEESTTIQSGVLEELIEEGSLHPSRTAAAGGSRGRSFAQGYSARATQRCRSTIISASGDRAEASPASDVAIER